MIFFTGDQSDKNFLERLIQEGAGVNPANLLKAGKSPEWDRVGWDLVIDDGSHVPRHQLISFIALYPFVRPGGIYVIEDRVILLGPPPGHYIRVQDHGSWRGEAASWEFC
jgi:hypothetical protein